jgi:HSP20 family protein
LNEKGKQQRQPIDIDVGLGLGGIFKGIGSLLDLAARMAQEDQPQTSRSGEVEGLGGRLKGVYGVSVRMGLRGKPVIEHFGNVRETEAGPVVAATREPLVDLLDEEDQLVVIVELPGVDEKDIQIKVEADALEVKAASGDRRYEKAIPLPMAARPSSVQSFYRNGVLEVRLAKQE